MSERIKIKLGTWDAGRKFMEDLASALNLSTVEEDALLYIRSDKLTASCFFDEREFAFIKIKFDALVKNTVERIVKRHSINQL